MTNPIPITTILDRALQATALNRQRKLASPRNSVKRMPLAVLPKVHYRNDKEVGTFLTAQPRLIQFLQAAWPILTKHFGKEIELILEVITYPYAIAQDELVGWIQFAGSIDDGLAKLDRFVDEWFLDHMEEVNNQFNFNVEVR